MRASGRSSTSADWATWTTPFRRICVPGGTSSSYSALGGVPVTVLRAAVVVGHGGISWEITRQLVDHLPAMVTPKWVNTKTQPIALPDVVRYLVGVLDQPAAIGRIFEVGGPEVLRYVDMMRRAAQIQNGRTPPIVPVPLLTPRLSSMWLALVTDVDQSTARNLVDSMNNEVVVTDDAITRLLPGELIGYDDSVRLAIKERADSERASQEPTDQDRQRVRPSPDQDTAAT